GPVGTDSRKDPWRCERPGGVVGQTREPPGLILGLQPMQRVNGHLMRLRDLQELPLAVEEPDIFRATSTSHDEAVADFSGQRHDARQEGSSIDRERAKHESKRHCASRPEWEKTGRVMAPPGRCR